ncbi:hypothetical protein DLAC_03471 [Tieghemostelium lacteum]|uniref:Transmembrane protein n=1 Tax=Tieghemostelium lacteum TaxID=361077 RepID=A0A152A221_TIELA|nr:hypothetical protein DLAC_03471 [Tieghemostelium lacteum]|eukprot:KYR00302.1 hypothetical protein DLAC_03471 [Tieghemostelium lacteum]
MMHAIGDLFKPDEKPLEIPRDTCGFTCCLIWTFKSFVRTFCLIVGFVQLAFGGYVFYQVSDANSYKTKSETIVQTYLRLCAIGIFAVLSGLLIIFAESRTRWTRRAVKVFIILCTGLARGLIYIVIAAVDIGIPFEVKLVKLPIPINSKLIGAAVAAAGLLSIIEYLLTWRRNRLRFNKTVSEHQEKTKKTQLYDLFERDEPIKKPPSKDPIQDQMDLEMQPVKA